VSAAELAWRAFPLLLGPFAGDYAATFAASWPRLPRPLVGRTRCARCGAPIPALHQIPIASWLAFRGRRACCGGRIPAVYPIGEAAGLMAGVAAGLAPSPAVSAFTFALGLTLTYLALVDLRRFSLPVAGLVALGGEAVVLLAASPDELFARLATGGVLALVFAVLSRMRPGGRRAGLGEGDVVLAGLLGVLVSWRLAAPMICLATLPPILAQYPWRKSHPTPLGFWLNLSAAVVLLAGRLNLASR